MENGNLSIQYAKKIKNVIVLDPYTFMKKNHISEFTKKFAILEKIIFSAILLVLIY